MDHYGYSTRPLVEYNLDLYTERASFLGWLGHMSERRRLAITLDPAASDPAKFKNKRVQVSEDPVREESEPEIVPVDSPSSTNPSSSSKTFKQRPVAKLAKTTKRKKETDSGDDYRPPVKIEKSRSKRSSPRSKRASKAPNVKPNTSAYGTPTDDGGKHPRHLYRKKQEVLDSDTSRKDKEDDKESHSDSFTDS